MDGIDTRAQLQEFIQGVVDKHPLGAAVRSLQSAALALTSLPTNPVDAQEIFYLADATNGVMWHLRYRAAEVSALKWYYVGGPPLYAEVLTNEATNATANTYQDLATVGPSITAPLAGDYVMDLAAQCNTAAVAANFAAAAVKIGAAATSDNEAILVLTPAAATTDAEAARRIVRNVSAAATVVKLQYKTSSANAVTFARRNLALTPVRVG